jgi:predicted TIM-barrel fold metal-dependent hydrolase
MSHAAAVKRTAEQVLGKDKIVSSDSHIMEPPDLWEAGLTPSLKPKFPQFPPRNTAGEKPGGHDPKARLDEMAVDGVSAEVLYATHGLRLYALEDAELQESCFQIANDWMMEYCKTAPGPVSYTH